jgi:hypothetical protein
MVFVSARKGSRGSLAGQPLLIMATYSSQGPNTQMQVPVLKYRSWLLWTCFGPERELFVRVLSRRALRILRAANERQRVPTSPRLSIVRLGQLPAVNLQMGYRLENRRW